MTDDLIAEALADPDAVRRALDLADARDSFAHFCSMIEIPQAPIKDEFLDIDNEAEDVTYRPAKLEDAAHLVLLQHTLDRVESGELPRLMVFMPPGGAKSTYCSVVFPPYFMGKKRRRNVILATYGSNLAKKLGRRARSIIRQPVYAEIFDKGLSPDTSAADEWALTDENEFMSGGILSGITGNRADLIVIDDPIKGRQEADSETIRERTWAEFKDSLRTRMKPGCRIVVVQTRWHEDDLSGRILPEDYNGESGWVDGRDGEKWYVISIPAEADRDDDPLGRKRGEMFWPEWFPAAHWAQFRQEPRTWASLYQQKPKPDEGSYFLRSWFKRFRPAEVPQSVRYYITSDYATKDGEGDWTVHQVWAVDPQMHVWLMRTWREKATSDVWIEGLLDLVSEFRNKGGPVRCIGEKGVIWNAINPAFERRARERKISARVELLTSQVGDKPTRARGFQSMARQGQVHIPDDMDGDVFIEEATVFPAGRHDDQVDAASLVARSLELIAPAARERPAFADTGEVF